MPSKKPPSSQLPGNYQPAPPMSMKEAFAIADLVEARLRFHLPNLIRDNLIQEPNILWLRNPANGQAIRLIDIFRPETHGAVGYRVWTLESVPELLKHLLGTQPNTDQTGNA